MNHRSSKFAAYVAYMKEMSAKTNFRRYRYAILPGFHDMQHEFRLSNYVNNQNSFLEFRTLIARKERARKRITSQKMCFPGKKSVKKRTFMHLTHRLVNKRNVNEMQEGKT